jgi:hypothetical protein
MPACPVSVIPITPHSIPANLGRSGELYRAWDPVRDREVALWVLDPVISGNQEAEQFF